jgi:hypothetical protein
VARQGCNASHPHEHPEGFQRLDQSGSTKHTPETLSVYCSCQARLPYNSARQTPASHQPHVAQTRLHEKRWALSTQQPQLHLQMLGTMQCYSCKCSNMSTKVCHHIYTYSDSCSIPIHPPCQPAANENAQQVCVSGETCNTACGVHSTGFKISHEALLQLEISGKTACDSSRPTTTESDTSKPQARSRAGCNMQPTACIRSVQNRATSPCPATCRSQA